MAQAIVAEISDPIFIAIRLQGVGGVRADVFIIRDPIIVAVPSWATGLVRPAAVLIDPVPASVAKTGSDSRICIVAISLGFTETIAVVVYLGAWQVSPITVLVDTIITGFQSAGSSPKVIVITIPIAWIKPSRS